MRSSGGFCLSLYVVDEEQYSHIVTNRDVHGRNGAFQEELNSSEAVVRQPRSTRRSRAVQG